MTQTAKSPFIFTLEDNPTPADDWEQSLQALRQRSSGTLPPEGVTISRQTETDNRAPAKFGDRELDAAYREYLRQREAEHNARPDIQNDDVGVLIQEDWLAAQTALQSERNRRYLEARETVLLGTDGISPLPETDNGSGGSPQLPEIAVHIYDLPDLPSTRRIKILSEQELVQTLHDKLKPHLSNAVAGMVRQILQKKLATLSYELQMVLNEETPQLVQDVLEHNLGTILRSVKDSVRHSQN